MRSEYFCCLADVCRCGQCVQIFSDVADMANVSRCVPMWPMCCSMWPMCAVVADVANVADVLSDVAIWLMWPNVADVADVTKVVDVVWSGLVWSGLV